MCIASSPESTASEFVTDTVARRVGFRAARLRRKYGLSGEDEKDLRQDFWATITRAASRFDPSRCPADRYVLMVLNFRYKHHVRELSRATSRGRTSAISIDDAGSAAAELMPDHSAPASLERACLAHDVDVVLAKLSPKDRRVCRAVMESRSPTDAATILGVSPWTVYRALKRLRHVFADHGMAPLC